MQENIVALSLTHRTTWIKQRRNIYAQKIQGDISPGKTVEPQAFCYTATRLENENRLGGCQISHETFLIRKGLSNKMSNPGCRID